MQRAILGIDWGGTKLSGALFSIEGEPIHSSGKTLTMGFITTVWMTVTTVAEILAERGV